LLCVAVCCGVLVRDVCLDAIHDRCHLLQCVAAYCSVVLLCVAVCCSVLQCVAVWAVCYSVLR